MEYLSKEKIDIILIVVRWQYQNIAIVAVYNSPKNTYRKLEENLIPAIQLGKLYATKVVVVVTPTFPLSVYYRLDRFGPKGSLTWTGELGNPNLWILLAFHGFI